MDAVWLTWRAPKSSKRLRTPGAAEVGVIAVVFIMHLTALIYSIFSVELKADHSLRTTTFFDVQVADASDVLASRIARILALALSTMASRVLFVEAETVLNKPEVMANKSVVIFILRKKVIRKNEDETSGAG